MLQPHSFLWNYLWVAPNMYLLMLAGLLWKRGKARQLPVFIAFAVLSSIGQLAVYTADVVPSVSAENFWRADWASTFIESVLKFALVAEIFGRVFNPYASLAKLGKFLIRGVGAALVIIAVAFAVLAPADSPYGLIHGSHLFNQAIYLIETGLLLFMFLFAAHFRFRLERSDFGIALGLAVSSCVHLATWAIAANVGLPASKRVALDFINMATYHVTIGIWYYYLLVPEKVRNESFDPPSEPPSGHRGGPPPDDDLEAWNKEMEHLLHK